MKSIFLFSILLISLTNFSIFKTKWIKTKRDNVVLYTRPQNFSDSISPDSARIEQVLSEAIACIKEINKKLGTNFNAKVKVYLFNYDEAMEQIGTNAGGAANVKENELYYVNFRDPSFDPIRKRNSYIGVHEYVHLVSFNELGFASTRLMAEGYACAIDGCYGSKVINGRRTRTQLKDQITFDKIKKPSELLDGEDMPEGDFYPQAGIFVNWLFNEYSVEKVNKIFVLKKEDFESEFEKITGESFQDMEKKYLEYCKQTFS